jgi:hypothetical protein
VFITLPGLAAHLVKEFGENVLDSSVSFPSATLGKEGSAAAGCLAMQGRVLGYRSGICSLPYVFVY